VEAEFDSLMDGLTRVQDEKHLARLLPVARWGQLILDRTEAEWQSLVALRAAKPLSEWYRGDYLQSKLWAGLRELVLENDGGRCLVCRQPASVVHHTTYDNDVMRGLDLRFLWSLCGFCHKAVEFDGGRKLSVFESSARLELMCKQQR
jgi:hypothetical protein